MDFLQRLAQKLTYLLNEVYNPVNEVNRARALIMYSWNKEKLSQ